MSYCIAVFRSKTDVFSFIEKLRTYGIYAEIVGTPKEAKVGCGLSVKFNYSNLAVATKILRSSNLASFYALYQVNYSNGRTARRYILHN